MSQNSPKKPPSLAPEQQTLRVGPESESYADLGFDEMWGASISKNQAADMTVKSVAPGKGADSQTEDLTGRICLRKQHVAQQGAQSDPPPHYELLDELGAGGMGVVYLARQTASDRRIALKMITPQNAGSKEAEASFLAEAIATSDLEHPSIVPVYDIATTLDGRPFYVMKYVQGKAWSDSIQEMSLLENLRVLSRVANATAFAHSRGILHRDLKPENVMLGEFGEVVLMDWGLAVAVDEEGRGRKLDTGSLEGTPCYMAPEMAKRETEYIDRRSDVYLLGALLFVIVCGTAPHEGDATLALQNAAANLIRKVDKKKRGELYRIAIKAMATRLDERYQSVTEFLDALRNYQEHHESVAIMERARRTLSKAIRERHYELFTDAIYGFRQARRLWKDNTQATEGLLTARMEYARCAIRKHDYDLALTQLDPDHEAHVALRQKVLKARSASRARRNVMPAIGNRAIRAITPGGTGKAE